MSVMGRGTPKKAEPETPQVREARHPPGFDPFIDLQAGIRDPQYPFHISTIKPELFRRHIGNKDRYRVVASGLYHQITPQVHSVVDFISWLKDVFDEHRGTFTSPQGNKVFSLSLHIIKQALCFPTSATYISFREEALVAQFTRQPWDNQKAFISSITRN